MSDLIMVGDRVLIRPETGDQETESGLVLPASVTEKEKVRSGRVIRVGPGYVMPNPEYSEGEPWKQTGGDAVRYLPLQAKPGDFAFFLRKEAIELIFEGTAYLIVPHGAILSLVRQHPEDLVDDFDDIDGLFGK